MKHFTVMLFVLGLAVATTPRAIGQGVFGLSVSTTPSVTIEVLNNTSDNTLIGPVVNGTQDRTLTPRGSMFKRNFYDNSWGLLGNKIVSYQIFFCPVVTYPSANALYEPPQWASEEASLGEFALTESYLQHGPNERDLEKRVDAIHHLLDSRNEPGRKDKIKVLKNWLGGIKKAGLRPTDQICSQAYSTIKADVLNVTAYYGWHTILIEAAGSREKGYTIAIKQGW